MGRLNDSKKFCGKKIVFDSWTNLDFVEGDALRLVLLEKLIQQRDHLGAIQLLLSVALLRMPSTS